MPYRFVSVALAAAILASASVNAQNDAENGSGIETVNCISLSRVDDTRIADEQTILFYMSNGDIYRNALPHRCPGLDRNATFMYRVPTTQLCSVDVITLLDDFGSRFMPAASCGLGAFQRISDAQAEEILGAAELDED